MSVDARPTLDAPDDDPYLWLEEIEGERALAFVERQNKLTLAKFGGAAVRGRPRHAGRDLRPAGQHPLHRAGAARFVYNIWKDAEQSARPVAAHDARRVPQGRARVGRHPRPRRAGEKPRARTGSWRGASTLPGSHDRAMLGLSRGGSDAAVLREFDVDDSAVRRGRLCPARGEGRRGMARRRHVAAVAAPMRRATWRRRPAMRGRSGCGGAARTLDQAPVLFEVPAESMAAFAASIAPAPERPMWFVDAHRLLRLSSWFGDATGPRRSSTCRPTSGSSRIRTGWSVKRRSAWTVGGKTYPPDTHARHPLSAFLAGEPQFHDAVRARPSGARCKASSGRRPAGRCRSSTS